MLDNYYIVGRGLEQGGIKFLHADGKIDLHPTKNGVEGTPLTVDFIGKKIVELSQKGENGITSAERDLTIEHLKQALVVRGPDGHDPNDPDLEIILKNTELVLEYDKRFEEGGIEKNIRTLVVPVPDTLAYRESEFLKDGTKPGHEPPLTYALDKQLMRAYFGDILKETIGELEDENGNALSTELAEKLVHQVDEKLNQFDQFGAAAPQIKKTADEVLLTPVAAFYRAVGIYITNMCD